MNQDEVDALLDRLRKDSKQTREPCPLKCGGYKIKRNGCTYCSNNEIINPETTIKCEWGVCE